MSALIYRPNHKWSIMAALTVAAALHLAAFSFATTREAPPIASGFPAEPEIGFDPPEPVVDPPSELSDPLPTPPVIDESYVEDTATPPPVRRQPSKTTPLVRSRTTVPGSVNLSTAKVFALSAPRPEYPYEARRQKITGDGLVVMSVDPGSGNVAGVTMAKSTGNVFLDNAAIAGFKRWRFKPGSVSTVTCPVTFTLSGANY